MSKIAKNEFVEDVLDDKDIDIDENQNIQDDFENEVVEKSKNKYSNKSKDNTVTLKQIKEVLGNKVNKDQKKSIIKDIFVNIFIAVIMIIYLVLLIMGSFNIDSEIYEQDIKVITLSILAIGIFILELSYKKDSTKIIIHGIEVLVFGASNLCLIYVMKLYFDNLTNIIKYIGTGVIGYYVLKTIICTIRNVRKYKKDNNDIREIVGKKVKEI